MGNSGVRKILYPGEVVETKYTSLYDMEVIDLDKNVVPLSQYKNKFTLCVNIASQHSDAQNQFNELKTLASRLPKDQFEILAFPSNEFSNEPGNFKTMKQIYMDKFGVTFPVFAKAELNGKYTHPVFKYLRRYSTMYKPILISADSIKEDFSKFLVDKNGQVRAFYGRRTSPESIIAQIQQIEEESKQVVPEPKTKLVKEAVRSG